MDELFGKKFKNAEDPQELIAQEDKMNRTNVFSAFGGRTIGTGEDGRTTVNLQESPENQRLRQLQQQRAEGFFSQGGDFGRGDTEKALFERSLALAQPERERARTSLETDLSLKGLPIGSEAYQKEQNRLGTQQSEQLRQLALQSVLAGGAESRAEREQQFSEIQPALQSQLQSQSFIQGLSDVQPINVSGIFGQQEASQRAATTAENERRKERNRQISQAISVAFASDKRLKKDIEKIGISENGINIYKFRYNDIAKTLFVNLKISNH